MNDFIVYGRNLKQFIEEDYMFFLNSNGNLCAQLKNGQMVSDGDTEAFKYIGKKDTNRNKIYENSSIVEIKLHESDSLKYHNPLIRGYFIYDIEKCCYSIQSIMCNKVFAFHAIPFYDYIKIIDTIQENKLGLISAN